MKNTFGKYAPIFIMAFAGGILILPLIYRSHYIVPVHKQCAGTKVHVGMDRQEVINLCGNPEKINTTDSGDGPHEQWVYDTENDYVYLEHGKVTSVQY